MFSQAKPNVSRAYANMHICIVAWMKTREPKMVQRKSAFKNRDNKKWDFDTKRVFDLNMHKEEIEAIKRKSV